MNAQPESPIVSIIKERVAAAGKITFAEFMELALYHPRHGYYASRPVFGAAGDYFTSPAAHPVFGALLAVQLLRMWELLDKPDPFYVIEPGSGNGILARDILDYLDKLPDTFRQAVRYVSVDRFSDSLPGSWSNYQHICSDGIPLKGIIGCFISNELLDAFPVHRFKIANGEIMEIYVALDEDDAFIEILDTPSTPLIEKRLSSRGISLPEGFQGEVNAGIASWIRDLSMALKRGFVITIDYGYEADELYSDQRKQGTLQTYYRHTDGASPYQRVGRQDMTSHVDFSLVQSEGAAVGLKPLGLISQSEFLRGLGISTFAEGVKEANLNLGQRRANLMGIQQLIDPNGLGKFNVLIQERNTGLQQLAQLKPDDSLVNRLAPPLLSQEHMPLAQSNFPQATWEPPPELWPFSDEHKES